MAGKRLALDIIREQGKDKRHPSRIEIPDSDIRKRKTSVMPARKDELPKIERVKSEHDGFVTQSTIEAKLESQRISSEGSEVNAYYESILNEAANEELEAGEEAQDELVEDYVAANGAVDGKSLEERRHILELLLEQEVKLTELKSSMIHNRMYFDVCYEKPEMMFDADV